MAYIRASGPYIYVDNDNCNDSDFARIIKETGIITNYFFAYKEGEKLYLLDGFNRLLTDYGNVDDSIVYLKVITNPLKDPELMSIMLYLNLWKLYGHGYYRFDTNNFFDRGFRLLLKKKYDIEIYSNIEWKDRLREHDDFYILNKYFVRESKSTDMFKYSYLQIKKLFAKENIVNDLREIIKGNDYLKSPFNNYSRFLNGFTMFLSRRRLSEDNSKHEFKTYLDLLYKDKFFKKLQNMSWTDSTRQNVFAFFKNIEEQLDKDDIK